MDTAVIAIVRLNPAGPENWHRLKSLVLNSLFSVHSRRAYDAALDEFLLWFQCRDGGGFTKAVVQQYVADLQAKELAPSSIKVRLSAIRRLAAEAADNQLLDPSVASAIQRVRGPRRQGVRLGNWLTAEQAEALIASPDAGRLSGKRDRVVLGLLMAAGLRREEVCRLTMEHLQLREGRWLIADLIGKRQRIRSIPIPAWLRAVVDDWVTDAKIDSGIIVRSVDQRGRVCPGSISTQTVFRIVRNYSARIGLTIAPHDLRRTFAKLAREGQAGLEQIQLSLGHASVATTELYLGTRQDLQSAPCDHIHIFEPSNAYDYRP